MLDEIKKDIETLIFLYEEADQENRRLRDELEQSKIRITDYVKQIAELEKKIDNNKLLNAFVGKSPDNNEAKERVDKLIKEIDKCISLMQR